MSVILRKSWVVVLAILVGSAFLTNTVFAEHDEIEISFESEKVAFPASKALDLYLPEGWTEKVARTSPGAIEITEHLVFDDSDRLVFKLGYPLKETGYGPMTATNRRELDAQVGTLEVVDRLMTDDPSSGFVHYMYGSQRDWVGDFWQDSFEIFVPFRESTYAGYETRYKSYQGFQDSQSHYAGSMDYIVHTIDFRELPRENDSDLEKCEGLRTSDIDKITVSSINAALGTDKVTVTYHDDCVFSYETNAYKVDSDDWKKYLIEEIVERINGSEITANPDVTYTDVANVIEFIGDSYPNDLIPEVDNTETSDTASLRAQLMRLIEMLQQLLQLQSLLGR